MALRFDPVAGLRLHDEVSETLMVKILDAPTATQIESTLLRDAVRTLDQGWYAADPAAYSSDAARRINDDGFGTVLACILASLPAGDSLIPLGEPSTG